MIHLYLHKMLYALLAAVLGVQTMTAVGYLHEPLADDATVRGIMNPANDHAADTDAGSHCADGHACVLAAVLSAGVFAAGAASTAARFRPRVVAIASRQAEPLLRPPRPTSKR